MFRGSEELTVLLVAEGERLAPALRERLGAHELAVVDCTVAKVVDTAFFVAPDLVVLAGDAAEDGGIDVLAALAARPATATLPVVLVSDHARAGSTFRHGVVAVVERTASADELASRIAEIARELPERTGEARGALGEGSIGELLELLAESLRTGILSVTGPSGESARVVLRADRPATEVIEQIVERLRPLAGAGGALRYEFHETPTGRLGALDLGMDEDAIALSRLSRDRLLLIEQNPARADLLAQGLRAYGARVAVADGLGRGLELARELTPDVVIVDGSAIDGWALEALRKIRRDPWLRWASLMLVDGARLWRDERRPDVPMLAASVDALLRADRDLGERAAKETSLGARLEVVGPVRTLRALVETKLGLRVRVMHPRVIVDLDLSDGLVAGASARLPQGTAPAVEGPAALATLFAISSGRVQIERAEAPRSANVMAPLDDALAAAAREQPAVGPSLPPPSGAPDDEPLPPQPRLPREASQVAGLVGHLEQLLDELRTHSRMPPPTSEGASPAAVRPPIGDRTLPGIIAPPIGDRTLPGLVAPPTSRKPGAIAAPPVPEESTSEVDVAEVAMLRRRMRQSSQRLRAIGGARPAMPSPPDASDATARAMADASAATSPAARPAAARPGPLVPSPTARGAKAAAPAAPSATAKGPTAPSGTFSASSTATTSPTATATTTSPTATATTSPTASATTAPAERTTAGAAAPAASAGATTSPTADTIATASASATTAASPVASTRAAVPMPPSASAAATSAARGGDRPGPAAGATKAPRPSRKQTLVFAPVQPRPEDEPAPDDELAATPTLVTAAAADGELAATPTVITAVSAELAASPTAVRPHADPDDASHADGSRDDELATAPTAVGKPGDDELATAPTAVGKPGDDRAAAPAAPRRRPGPTPTLVGIQAPTASATAPGARGAMPATPPASGPSARVPAPPIAAPRIPAPARRPPPPAAKLQGHGPAAATSPAVEPTIEIDPRELGVPGPPASEELPQRALARSAEIEVPAPRAPEPSSASATDVAAPPTPPAPPAPTHAPAPAPMHAPALRAATTTDRFPETDRITPVLPPPRRGPSRALVIGGSIAVLVLVIGVVAAVAWLGGAGSGETIATTATPLATTATPTGETPTTATPTATTTTTTATPTTTTTAATPTTPQTATPTTPQTATTTTAATAAPSPATAVAAGASFGPGPGEGLEGDDADLDVAAIAVAPPRRPTGRRDSFTMVRNLLRDATTARRQDRPDDAARAYRQVLAIDPTNGRATAGLAYVHLERDELPQALLWAQRMVRTHGEYASHWVLLGDVLRRGGNLEAARRAYAHGLTVQPTWSTAQRRLDELDAAPR